ncbi:hypothetical protein WK77_16280 [Burkholderia ubonensis]|nr:hypothetical protein WK77_16280 [Burkholderia ubonensis]
MLDLLSLDHCGSWSFDKCRFDFVAVRVDLSDGRAKCALGFEDFDVLRILSQTILAQCEACRVYVEPLSYSEVIEVDCIFRRYKTGDYFEAMMRRAPCAL